MGDRRQLFPLQPPSATAAGLPTGRNVSRGLNDSSEQWTTPVSAPWFSETMVFVLRLYMIAPNGRPGDRTAASRAHCVTEPEISQRAGQSRRL